MRICCVSDTHLTVPELESASLFPRQIAALPEKQGKEMYFGILQEIAYAFGVCVQWLSENSL